MTNYGLRSLARRRIEVLPARRPRRPRQRHRRRRRALHGAPWPRRHRHEQPDRLGPARTSSPSSWSSPPRRAQRRLDRLGVRQDGLQERAAARRPALLRHAGRRPRRPPARPRPRRPHHGGRHARQLDVGVRLEHDPLSRHVRHRRRLSLDADGKAHVSVLEAGRLRRLHLAPDAHHRHRLDLRLPGRAPGLPVGRDRADVHHHVLRLGPGRLHGRAEGDVPLERHDAAPARSASA